MRHAIREQVNWLRGGSVFCECIRAVDYGTPWHFHPELELVLVRKSGGIRIVGDSIQDLKAGDLVLLGSNLPHVFCHDSTAGQTDAIVVQFHPTFAGKDLFRRSMFRPIRNLFERAKRGLNIEAPLAQRIAQRIEGLFARGPLQRVADLLGLLDEMARSPSLRDLTTVGYVPPLDLGDEDRLARVLRCIHERAGSPLPRWQLAKVAALSESAFSRFFKKRTSRTLPVYVNELRVGHAARLLIETPMLISEISRECGYRNLSNFNRLFLKYKGVTPIEFRKKVGGSDE
jgi:AraC-like DNA-binding protein